MAISIGYHNFLNKLCGKFVSLLYMPTGQFLNGATKIYLRLTRASEELLSS